MKVGDKMYCQSKRKDVIVVDLRENNVDVCLAQGTSNIFTVSKSDLLEYEGKPKQAPTKANKSDLFQLQQEVNQRTPRINPYAVNPCAESPFNRVHADHYSAMAQHLKQQAEDGYFCTPVQQKQTKKEGIKMNLKNLMGEIGKVRNGEVAVTFDGKVVVRRNADEYVGYDAEKQQIVNHMSLVLPEASKFIFVMPVTEVAVGDVIKFRNEYFEVLAVNANGSIHAINLGKGTKSTICKETNLFGLNFYSKVTNLFNPAGQTAGAFNPLMLLAMKDGSDFEDILPLLAMQGGAGATANPLLMMSVLGKGDLDVKDLLMMQAFGGAQGGTGLDMSNPLLMMSLLK